MDYTSKATSLQSLKRGFNTGVYGFSHPLQRKEDNWNSLQKSEFIDSLLRRYPVNPVYVIKNEQLDIIDGLQRLSTIRDYLNDEFALSDKLYPVEINGTYIVLNDKKFSDLDEETQEHLLAAEIHIYSLTDCEDSDVVEMFRRQNNGTALSKTQKSIIYLSEDFLKRIKDTLDSDFWQKTGLTVGQVKKDEDRDIVIQTLSLLVDNNDIGDFKTAYLYEKFATYFEDLEENVKDEYFERFKVAIEKLNEAFEEKQKNLKKVTLPIVIYAMDYCLENDKDTDLYIEWLKEFLDTYDTQEEYKSYCASGSASKSNVLGRKRIFDKFLETL